MNKKAAYELLKKYRPKDYKFLGEGNEGFIFTDGSFTYKVLREKPSYKNVCFILENINKFKNSSFLPEIFDINKFEDTYIVVSEYIKGEVVNSITEEEGLDFLIECWRNKLIFRNIKLENFIRDKNNNLKFIDISLNGDIQSFNDNYFINMAARLFIDIKYFNKLNKRDLTLLKRSSINNFKIPELKGFQRFLNKLFNKIIFSETELVRKVFSEENLNNNKILKVNSNMELVNYIKEINENNIEIIFENFKDFNLENIFWQLLKFNIRLEEILPINLNLDEQGYHKPKYYKIKAKKLVYTKEKVSLLIKACPQDSKTIYQQVKHILKQLLSPNAFFEKVIAIDKKESNFLRQYTDEGSLKELYQKISKLIEEGLIDYMIELPENEIENVNFRWFKLKTNETHTITNIPVTPQLYAFENIQGDYILQMDSDVLIGREDYNHSFLQDMLDALKKNLNAVSVGFNIPKNKNVKFVEYHAPLGEYKPEVRFALIDKKRFLNSRPWPNEVVNGKLKLSWYQSLHKHQKEKGLVSLRGGNPKSYYMHPQNYRKQCEYVWMTILDRVEQNIISDMQREGFDVEGNFYDWCIPKRKEDMVLITCFKDVKYERFLRLWNSVLSQSFKEFGWIIIDDNSQNGIEILIKNLIKKFNLENRITFIKNRFTKGILFNTYLAIHYFIDNPNSIIVIVDGDDALLGKNALKEIYREYQKGADLTVGKMYRTDKLFDYYPYKPNFINPRLYGGNVWQHIRTFKKYLFDSINLNDFMHKFEKRKDRFIPSDKRPWFKYCSDFAYMIPMVEMSENPKFIENYNYLHERTTPNTPEIREKKDKIIEEILQRKKYSTNNRLTSWRKDFIPNIKRIEIDITYDCNLKCFSCNRSCSQAPSKEDYMELIQIEKFIKESIEFNHKWELINILGGEPTLHPQFIEIVELILKEYIWKFSPDTILQITSNGYTEKTLELLRKVSKYKNVIVDKLSFKDDKKIIYFSQFNVAPIDLEKFKNADFSKGCWITSYCGVGLNKYGYYACSVAGGIDRVIGLDRGIKSLKDLSIDKLKFQLNQFCRYCGNFVDYDINRGDFIPRCEKAPFKKPKITKTWEKFYRNFKENKIKLTHF